MDLAFLHEVRLSWLYAIDFDPNIINQTFLPCYDKKDSTVKGVGRALGRVVGGCGSQSDLSGVEAEDCRRGGGCGTTNAGGAQRLRTPEGKAIYSLTRCFGVKYGQHCFGPAVAALTQDDSLER